jgi:hypothetical protein
MELPKQLAMLNVKDLLKMIQVSCVMLSLVHSADQAVERGQQVRLSLGPVYRWLISRIRFLRMSSEMFPFASHEKYGYSLEYADAELKEAGALAKKYGHRLTMHPGQVSRRDIVRAVC